MTAAADFMTELEKLKKLFIADLDNLMNGVESAYEQALRTKQQRDRDDLIRQVHSLSGTAGMFGLTDISREARILEDALEDAVPDVTSLSKAGQDALHALQSFVASHRA